MGKFLAETKPTAAQKSRNARQSPTVRRALANIARQAGLGAKKEFTAFDVKVPKAAGAAVRKAAGAASRYFVAVQRRKAAGPIGRRVVAVAKEANGRIVGYRIYLEK